MRRLALALAAAGVLAAAPATALAATPPLTGSFAYEDQFTVEPGDAASCSFPIALGDLPRALPVPRRDLEHHAHSRSHCSRSTVLCWHDPASSRGSEPARSSGGLDQACPGVAAAWPRLQPGRVRARAIRSSTPSAVQATVRIQFVRTRRA